MQKTKTTAKNEAAFMEINLFLAVLAILLAAIPVYADLSVTNTTIIPATVRPGTGGVISMLVSNPDSSDAYSVSAEATGSGYVHAAGSTWLGDFKSGVSGIAAIPFSVPSGAPAGIYTLSVKFSWLNGSGTRYKNIQVPLTVANPAIFSVQAANKSIYTSGDFDIVVKISNSGGAARNLRVSVNSSSFLQTSENPLVIGDLGRLSSEEFTLGVALARDTESGAYSLPLAITYMDEAGQETSAPVALRLEVKKKSPRFELSLTEPDRQVNPGIKLPLKLKISNNGDEDAYDVGIALANEKDLESVSASDGGTPVLTLLGSNNQFVGDLASGESKVLALDVGVNDIVPGFYSPYFVLKSKNANGDSYADELIPVGMNVQGISEVSVYVSSKPAPLKAGGEHTLSILVSNVGTSPIKALSVKANGGTFSIQDAQDEQFVGGLQQDDFSTVQFKVRVPDLKTGDYPLNVTAKFKDSHNNDHVQSQIVKLRVIGTGDSQGAGDGGLLLAIIALIIIIAVGAFVWHKYAHKEKKK